MSESSAPRRRATVRILTPAGELVVVKRAVLGFELAIRDTGELEELVIEALLVGGHRTRVAYFPDNAEGHRSAREYLAQLRRELDDAIEEDAHGTPRS